MPLRLFIVEDSASVVEALSHRLTADGRCEVVGTAANEADALAWSFHNEAAFDVAIVDLLLSAGSGFSVLAHLHKYQPGKIVVFSEFITPVIRERCKSLGAVAAFQKSESAKCIEFVRAMAGSN